MIFAAVTSECFSMPFLEVPSLYFTPNYSKVFQVTSFPQSSYQSLNTPVLFPIKCHMLCPPYSFYLITSNTVYLVRSTDHTEPRCVVLPPSSHPSPLRPKCLPQQPILEHSQPMLLPRCKRPISTPTQEAVRISAGT